MASVDVEVSCCVCVVAARRSPRDGQVGGQLHTPGTFSWVSRSLCVPDSEVGNKQRLGRMLS